MICREGIPYKTGDPLPLLPGDIVYEVSTYHFYEIREKTVPGIALYQDRCCVVLDTDVFPIVKDCEVYEIDDVFFRTREDAEAWKKKHLTEPPYTLNECDRWVSPEQYVPESSSWHKVHVKLQTEEGIVKAEAYYDDGSEYPEDKGFWDGTKRHSKKYDNVIAWIDSGASDEEINEG